MSRSESALKLAEYIDRCTQRFATDKSFRTRLLSEHPEHRGKPMTICEQSHPHGRSANCYQRHGCRCTECTTENTARNRRARMAGAMKALASERATA